MGTFAYNLFLLMVNLSQMHHKERIIGVFKEAIADLLHTEVQYSKESSAEAYRIQTKNHGFGYIHVVKELAPEERLHLQNAVQMLAVLLERLHQKELLENENMLFEHLVAAKTANLEESQGTFRALTENTPDIILRLNTQRRIIFINKQIANYTGLEAEDLTGEDFSDIHLPKENLNALLREINNVLGSKTPHKCTTYHKFQQREVCLGWRFFPELDKYNNIKGILGTARDETKEQEYRSQLIAAKERAEQADKLKTAFLSNISHEIRTPLNAILGFSNLLIQKKPASEENRNFVSIIKENSNQLLKVIDELLDISRIEAGEIQMAEQEFEINNLLNELKMENEEQLRKTGKNISFTTYFENQLKNSVVISDRRRLKQALNNILENAIKFTEKGSISFSCTYSASKIRFVVADTGVGIPEDKHSVIFERFRQAEETLTRNYGGNGLGLAISRAFIELLQGNIYVNSIPGEGSSFTVEIPARFADTS